MGNGFKHFRLITKHRHQVIRNGFHLGIFFHCLKHDLSKYSHYEFSRSKIHYKGISSPVFEERKFNDGYSEIAVHHTSINKHHFEYYIDFFRGYALIKPIPFKYLLEYVADMLAASKTYDKKNFSGKTVYDYFVKREQYYLMHPGCIEFVKACFLRYEESKWKNLKKKDTKELYEECIKKYKPVYIYKMEKIDDEPKEILYGK